MRRVDFPSILLPRLHLLRHCHPLPLPGGNLRLNCSKHEIEASECLLDYIQSKQGHDNMDNYFDEVAIAGHKERDIGDNKEEWLYRPHH